MKYSIFTSFLVLQFLTGCNLSAEVGGKKVVDADIGGGNKSTYTYELSFNGCSTGKKEFSSLESMCDTLKNDSANNNCASQMRYEYFQQNCPNRSWN